MTRVQNCERASNVSTSAWLILEIIIATNKFQQICFHVVAFVLAALTLRLLMASFCRSSDWTRASKFIVTGQLV